jgi:TIR domain-containing protein
MATQNDHDSAAAMIFISHAAADQELAGHLKQVIETCFPQINVFVSSDPEDLPPGDPWVQTVLANLKSAKVLLILATERGLNRKWVWFETGAGWSCGQLFIPCCVGKTRKGQLPHPFSAYQAINIDEEDEFGVLLRRLRGTFGEPEIAPELQKITREFIRLEIRAEEREKIRAANLAAEADHSATRALIIELEDNVKTARHFQSDRTYVPPANAEWLKVRASLPTLPAEVKTELTNVYYKIGRWKSIVDSGINPGLGSREIPQICKELQSDLPALIERLHNLLPK